MAATESVWDYPRPPKVVADERRVEVVLGGITIASSDQVLRVLETASPPAVYVPRADVIDGALTHCAAGPQSVCEWKGPARYLDATAGGVVAERAAWFYPKPNPGYAELTGYVSFYPGRVDACYFDGESVMPQPGRFYGGWITAEIEGPFKGGPGTEGW